MNKIEQLKIDIEHVKKSIDIFNRHEMHPTVCYLDSALGCLEDELAELEAQETDEWREAKEAVVELEKEMPNVSKKVFHAVRYLLHLRAENERLKAELAKRPVVYYAKRKRSGIFASRYDTPTEPMLYTKKEAEYRKNTDPYDVYDFEPYIEEKKL